MMKMAGAMLMLCVCSLFLLSGCDYFADDEVKQASRSYQQAQDVASLEMLHKQLKPGMTRNEVESLLGTAQYSPIAGVDYYPSAKDDPSQYSSIGLVVEYVNEQEETTNQVQKFWLGEVGE